MTEDTRARKKAPANSPISKRLASVVKRSGLKQAEIARRMGEEHDWVSNRVRGRTALAADDLTKFGEALRVDPCLFLHDDEGPARAVPADRATAAWAHRLAALPQRDVELLADFLSYRQQQGRS